MFTLSVYYTLSVLQYVYFFECVSLFFHYDVKTVLCDKKILIHNNSFCHVALPPGGLWIPLIKNKPIRKFLYLNFHVMSMMVYVCPGVLDD